MPRVFAISDLHLGPSQKKKHFSSHWIDHQPRMRRAWDDLIKPDDIVLMPGDISWNTDAADLKYELAWIDDRPGTKCISRGNHDHGVWEDREALEQLFSEFSTIHLVHETAVRLDCGLVVGGMMGCIDENDKFFGKNSSPSRKWLGDDEDRYKHEKATLEAVLTQAQELRQEGDGFCLLSHYPPFADGSVWTTFSWMIGQAAVDSVVYGHLHRKEEWEKVLDGTIGKTSYSLVSADALDFMPRQIGELTDDGFRVTTHAKAAERKKKSWERGIHTGDPEDDTGSMTVGVITDEIPGFREAVKTESTPRVRGGGSKLQRGAHPGATKHYRSGGAGVPVPRSASSGRVLSPATERPMPPSKLLVHTLLKNGEKASSPPYDAQLKQTLVNFRDHMQELISLEMRGVEIDPHGYQQLKTRSVELLNRCKEFGWLAPTWVGREGEDAALDLIKMIDDAELTSWAIRRNLH